MRLLSFRKGGEEEIKIGGEKGRNEKQKINKKSSYFTYGIANAWQFFWCYSYGW